MDIIIIADFLGDLEVGAVSRFTFLANMLCNETDSIEVITSDFNHGSKNYFTQIKACFPYKITMLHEGKYKKNVSIQRFFAHHKWGKNVEKYLKNRKKPDVIYAASPPLSGAYVAAKYCEKNNIRFIIDIQDLWPEAFKLALNIPIVSWALFLPFSFLANEIYKRADEICAVSKTYGERAKIVNKKVLSTHIVFLGTLLSSFDDNVKKNQVKKPLDEVWIGYCGTLGASYDISIVIDALNILYVHGVNTPTFIVMGDGERRKEFENHARKKKIKCMFTGNLPYAQMCGMLSACDIAVNPIMHNAAQSIINKHGDYCAAGLPVVNSQECQEYRDLVNEYQMGLNTENGDPVDFAEKLKILIEDNELRVKMGKNARKCAEERFDRGRTYKEIYNLIYHGTK